jgi:hypothetical protein
MILEPTQPQGRRPLQPLHNLIREVVVENKVQELEWRSELHVDLRYAASVSDCSSSTAWASASGVTSGYIWPICSGVYPSVKSS